MENFEEEIKQLKQLRTDLANFRSKPITWVTLDDAFGGGEDNKKESVRDWSSKSGGNYLKQGERFNKAVNNISEVMKEYGFKNAPVVSARSALNSDEILERFKDAVEEDYKNVMKSISKQIKGREEILRNKDLADHADETIKQVKAEANERLNKVAADVKHKTEERLKKEKEKGKEGDKPDGDSDDKTEDKKILDKLEAKVKKATGLRMLSKLPPELFEKLPIEMQEEVVKWMSADYKVRARRRKFRPAVAKTDRLEKIAATEITPMMRRILH